MEGELSFGVLGPLAIGRGIETVDIPRHKERQLLAALLLEANKTVSTDSLVEAIWGDQPPAKPLASLRACISGTGSMRQQNRSPRPWRSLVGLTPGPT